MIRKYKDFVAKGIYNKVLHLDDEWLIKTPLKKNELDPTIDNHEDISAQEIITRFKEHVNFMIANPKFFPEIKRLDKYRIAIRKLDTEKAKEELQHVVDYINAYIMGGRHIETILDELSRAYQSSRTILDKMEKSDDSIVKKWYDFIMSIRFDFPKDDLDIHSDNIGLEKDGTIKLLDF